MQKAFHYVVLNRLCNREYQPGRAYMLMRDALHAAGRPVLFSMCEWGQSKPWEWAKETGHQWRTTGDIFNCFDCVKNYGSWSAWGVMQILDMQKGLRKYAGPGHWNDPDMLEVGNGMPVNEDRAHFSTWAIICAPLILGNDIRNISKETIDIISNREVIAISQDKLGVQALRYGEADSLYTFFKPLENGDWAVCFLNRSKLSKPVDINWSSFQFTDDISGKSPDFGKITYQLRNVWTKKLKEQHRKI